jgi:hypothetical protein
MKKILAAAVLALLLTSMSNAQIKYGAKAGLNFSTFGGDDSGSPDSKVGVVLGGVAQYQFSNMFVLQPELLFSMKGAKYEGGGVKQTFSFNYIEVPVMVKFIIPLQGSSSITPSLFAGPAVALIMSADFEQEQNNQSASVDIKDNVNTLDFGLAFGGSIAFPLGQNELGVDIRYSLGLSSWDDSGNNGDIKNNAISLTAFFMFGN